MISAAAMALRAACSRITQLIPHTHLLSCRLLPPPPAEQGDYCPPLLGVAAAGEYRRLGGIAFDRHSNEAGRYWHLRC